MSGHSKWSTIKRQKAASDQKRGKIFSKLAKAITMAAREGGDDVESNFKLRLAVDRAKQANMPKENIERAITKVSGNIEDSQLDEVMYEGFAPISGVAFLVEAVTDNKMRTVAEIKNIIEKNGGRFGTPGSVSHMFEQKGEIVVTKFEGDDEILYDMAIDLGVDDIERSEEGMIFYTNPGELKRISTEMESNGVVVSDAGIVYVPTLKINVENESMDKLINFFEKINEQDDVQNIYVNVDIQ